MCKHDNMKKSNLPAEGAMFGDGEGVCQEGTILMVRKGSHIECATVVVAGHRARALAMVIHCSCWDSFRGFVLKDQRRPLAQLLSSLCFDKVRKAGCTFRPQGCNNLAWELFRGRAARRLRVYLEPPFLLRRLSSRQNRKNVS